jgi:hypothetical protein
MNRLEVLHIEGMPGASAPTSCRLDARLKPGDGKGSGAISRPFAHGAGDKLSCLHLW